MKAAALLVLLAAACVVTTSAGLFEPTLSSLLQLLFIQSVTLIGTCESLGCASVINLTLACHSRFAACQQQVWVGPPCPRLDGQLRYLE